MSCLQSAALIEPARYTFGVSKAAGQCGKMGSGDVGRTQPHSRAADVLRDTRCEISQSEAWYNSSDPRRFGILRQLSKEEAKAP